MRKITVLGATGSIGSSTLDVISRHPDQFEVYALTANSQFQKMFELCKQFKPQYVVMVSESAAVQLKELLNSENLSTEVLSGEQALEEVSAASDVDDVMAAIVGAAGLKPTLAAVREGKRILLANKEALVMTGHLFMEEVQKSGSILLPIDSEHNAIFQCMPSNYRDGLPKTGVRKILLTASGGPFRTRKIETLHDVTPAEAVAHPNWSMGQKISVDSATMMNKGLEVIEARWLFDASSEQIEVVIHPQSVIHSMVQYIDGSVLAELGNPDMRTPIAHALSWPERIESGVADLDIFDVARLDFEKPDNNRFPCLGLAFKALDMGGTAPAILNAANEVAVDAFLSNKIKFTQIAEIIEKSLNQIELQNADTLEVVFEADNEARNVAQQFIGT